MTADCLTCEEIELRICEIADEISSLTGCSGISISEDDTKFDYTPALKAKQEVLRVYKSLHDSKCKGAMPLYEFIHVPCVKPARCEGTGCNVPSDMRRNRRRYRR